MTSAVMAPKAVDYWAVYAKTSEKDKHPRFVSNVMAKTAADAVRIARDHGMTVPRCSFAVRIGLSGYQKALAATMGGRAS